MIIKKAKYRKVKVLQTRCVKDAVYGCDHCGKEIPEYPNEPSRLELTIFKRDDGDTVHEHLCSWGCVLKRLLNVGTNYFISLPYVHYDEGKGKRSATELVKILKRLK